MSLRVGASGAGAWLIGIVVALAAHAIGLAALVYGGQSETTAAGPIPIVVEIGEAAAMPSERQDAAPDERRQQQADARPIDAAHALVAPLAAEAEFALRQTEQRSDEAPLAQVAVRETTAPPATESHAASSQAATATYEQILLAHLERNKRYPRAARAHRQQGVAVVRFVMDRRGHVVSARLVRSSGHDLLDEEVLALLERAQPLPPPPASIPGATLELTTPVEFFLR